ncbi:MAG: NAD(P)/FAD-dependent oxidoreductase [Chloroflexi bacterium]|nr:MAG: NAD(P)/FAD-dependent oxidoreductase [Chloroflexota bacterium]
MEKDLIIIGGGPSGLSTALHLAQLRPDLSPRILVLEKAHYPRPKLCAGGLVADAEILLQRLGLDVREIPRVDAGAAHFDFAGRGLKIRLPRSHTLRLIRRDEFDAWLAAKARERGIEVREGIRMLDVQPDSDGVMVFTDAGNFRAQVVVGADGSNGITKRCILPAGPLFTARTLEVLAQLPQDGKHDANEAYFDFFPVPKGIAGYTWDFPTQVNGLPMRCWGIYDMNFLPGGERPPLKELLAAEMARQGCDLGDCDLQSHPIRWFDPFQRFCVPRVLLVGDAAGADPIFGEGISMALGYGKVAAQELADAFRREKFDLTGYKRRLAWSPLGQALVARWLVGYLVYSFNWKWFQILLWRVLKPVVILVAWLFLLNWARRMR